MDDLISRKALIEKHCAENCGCTRDECGLTYEEDGCDACTFVKEVEQAPTIEAEPVRHGEWVETKLPGIIACSACGLERHKNLNLGAAWRYCPKCGAKVGRREEGWLIQRSFFCWC